MADSKLLSLTELVAESGVAFPCAGNLPLDLDDPHCAWFIEHGMIDLFLMETREGTDHSAPQHLLRADSGRLLFGIAPQSENTTLRLVAKGLSGTVLRRLPVDSLGAIPNEELARHVDTWLSGLSATLTRNVPYRPRPDEWLKSGQELQVQAGTLSVHHGLEWVMDLPAGGGLYLGLVDPVESSAGEAVAAVPLTADSWVTLNAPAQISVRSSKHLAEEKLLLMLLESFHRLVLTLERLNQVLAVADQVILERARVSNRRNDEEGARQHLFNLYGLLRDQRETEAGSAALREVLQVIGCREGIEFKWPPKHTVSENAPGLGEILDVSGVRARQVRLDHGKRWWREDSGSMLAYRAADGQPVALVPGVLGGYREVDPVQRRSLRINARHAALLREDAWLFYPSLETAGVGLRALFQIAGAELSPSLTRFVAAGVLVGLILLLPAVMLGYIADEVIPAGDTSLLYAVTATLAVFALIGALLHTYQGLSLMRIEGRAFSRIESAFWDRLLRLPPGFLRRYSVGDIAMRGRTFQILRDAGQSVIANTVLSVFFLLPVFALILYYDTALAGLTAAFALASLFVTIVLGVRLISPNRQVIRSVHRLAGQLFQLINGISKLRVDNAEGSAFAVWAREYRKQKQAELELAVVEGHLQAFSAALPLLAGAVLLLAVTLLGHERFALGDFLVVYTVFLMFQAAVARLGESFSAVAAILPALDQIQPLLAESPEASAAGEPVEYLGGELAFDHVTFRYDPEGPRILDDVTIHARPGEFIAIAGESGAGKSTLFRLALGLEQPSAGAVYYDGRDLKHLNTKQVRRKIGVVPQEVQLHPEDIWDNVVGGLADATAEDAWQAARTAAVDQEIKAMPMGMLTCVGVGSSVTSGGESQRILIARSLIRNPRILLLDEATNWLDNESQSRVMANLAALTSTRIVIAHRLSTLRQADRIYVMCAGKVVQEGAFEELMTTEGVFQDLVRRQMT